MQVLKIKLHQIVLLFVFVFFPSCSVFKSEIEEINSLTEVKIELDKANNQTLVVFDMDDTLLSPLEDIFHLFYVNIDFFNNVDVDFIKQLRKEASERKKDSEYFTKIASQVFFKTKFIPVEESTIKIVKSLQNRSVKLIALTASNTGKFYEIDNMQKWRVSNLNQIGLNFSNSFNVQDIEFNEFPKIHGFPPAYYKGILCSASSPKGKVLKAFLDKISWKPSKVIFFDDMYHCCKSVATEMKSMGIPVKCYWYRAEFNKKNKINQQVMKYQFDHINKYDEFLTEEEVLERINNGL